MWLCNNPVYFCSSIMRAISSANHDKVISLLLAGYSSRDVQSQTGLGKSTVNRIKQTLEIEKENLKGGRPSKLSPADRRRITHKITTGHLDTAVQATHYINSVIPHPVCPQTVRNVLKQEDFRAMVKPKKPKLTLAHRKRRMEFALKHQNWTLDDWKRVLWSDESKINRFGSDGRKYVWKKCGEGLSDRTTQPTVKFGGGNIMVWGCMGWNGVGILTEVEGRMDKDQYVDILEHSVKDSFKKLEIPMDQAIFQQDNDPKHTSGTATSWFSDNGIEVLDWPAQSPDLNPIEHLWEHLKRQLHKYPEAPKGVFELWDRAAEEWNKIEVDVCQRLIESMPRRLEAVVKAKGGNTKY